MIPSLGSRFAAPVKKIGERRLDTQSVVQGNIEELNRFISQNEYQLKTKENELREAKRHIDNLEKELREVHVKNQVLSVNITTERKAREEIVQRSKQVQSMYSALKEKSTVLTESFKKTEETCQSAISVNASHDAVIKNLIEKIAQIDERARQQESDFNENVASLRSQMEEKQAEFDKAQQDLSKALDQAEEDKREKASRIIALDKEISDLRTKKESLEKERASLEEDIKRVSLEKDGVETAFQEQLEQYNVLEAKQKELMRQLGEMSADCDAKKAEITDQAKLIEELRGKIGDQEAKLAELDATVEEFKRAELNWSSQMEEARQREETLLSEKKSLANELADANALLEEIPKLNAKIGELELLISSLRSSEAELSRKCETNMNEIALKNAEIGCVLGELRSKDSDLKQTGELAYLFASKVNLLEADLEASKGDCGKAKQEIGERDSKITDLQANVERYEGDISGLQADLAKATRKSEELTEENNEFSKVIDAKERSIDNLKWEKESLLAEIAAKERDIASASEQIRELTAKADRLSSEIESWKVSMKGGEEKWLMERTELLEKLQKTEKSVSDFVRENDSLQRAISNEEQKMNALKSEKGEAEKARKAVEQELEKKTEEVAKWKQEVEAVRAEMKELQGALEKKLNKEREKTNQLEAKLTGVSSEVAEKNRELEARWSEIGEKSASLREYEQKVAELEQELEKVRLQATAVPVTKPADRSYVKVREGPQQDARRSPRLVRKSAAEYQNPLITVTNTETSSDFLEVLTQKTPVKNAPKAKLPVRPQPAPSRSALKPKSRELAKSTPSLQQLDFDSGNEELESRTGAEDYSDETWQPSPQKRSRKSAPPTLPPPVKTPKPKIVESVPKTPTVVPTPKPTPKTLKLADNKQLQNNLPGPARKTIGGPKRIILDPLPDQIPRNAVKAKPQQAKQDFVDPFAFLGDDE